MSTVETIAEAIQWTEEQTPSAIILDLNLPDSRGFNTIDRIRELDLDSVIIAWSGDADPGLFVDAVAHGADDFLCKGTASAAMLHRSVLQNLERVKHVRKIRKLVQSGKRKSEAIERQSQELTAKNKQLQYLYDSAQRFVNNVSHDLRTPLCVIRQYASLLADGLVGPIQDEQRNLLRIIEGRVDGLNNMVDDMLDYSRHQNGMLSASRQSCDVNAVIYRVIEQLQNRAAIKTTALIPECQPNLPASFCDVEKLERCLLNLMTNAIKFGQGNEVFIRSKRTADDEIAIEVQDSGSGISPEQLQTMFERFSRGHQQIRSDEKGFGLGLSIAREFADLNLGQLTVRSIIDEGSTFVCTVPVDQRTGVVTRHLNRLLDDNSDEFPVVSILTASVDRNEEREVDIFLNYLLRVDDLVYPLSDTKWLVILRSDERRCEEFTRRSLKEFNDINRNRPQGPLCEIDWEHFGSAAVCSDRIAIDRLITKAIGPVQCFHPHRRKDFQSLSLPVSC